jgi:hypothetical protein
VTEKNNSWVDCAEADKKTVQTLRFGMFSELTKKGEDFWRLGILHCGAARNKLSGET